MPARFQSLPAGLVLVALVALPAFSAFSAPQSGREPRFTLERTSIAERQPPKVLFERPLPAVPGEQYWITLVAAGEGDGEWGMWQYVADGASEVILQPAPGAGDYEVRLHDGYPRVGHHVAYRQALTVVPWSASAAQSGTTTSIRSDLSAPGATAAPGQSSAASTAPGAAAPPAPRLANSSGVLRGRKVSWEGLEGDAEDMFAAPSWISPDIVAVQAEGRSGEVIVTLVLDGDLNRMLNQKTTTGTMRGYLLADVYFDTDGDVATGREVGLAPGRKGYDVSVQIMTGLEFTSGGTTMTQFGNIQTIAGTHKVIGPCVTYSLEKRTGGGIGGGGSGEPTDKQITIKGRTLVVRVPYEKLGLEKRDTVRVCFVDHTMDLLDKGIVSCDAQLTLE